MQGNPVGWFEIYVQDMERAKTFYEAVFQLKLSKLDSPEFDAWGFPMQEGGYGATGALFRMEGVPSGGNSTVVYFKCDDCAEEVQRVGANGGKTFKDKFAIGQHGFIALVLDTEGNM